MSDADLLAARVTSELPPSSTWTMPPRGYRHALALCIVDGVARQHSGDESATELIASFRTHWGEAAEQAGASTLADTFAQDASPQVALITRAAELLVDHGIESTVDLVERLTSEGLNGPLTTDWTTTEGLTRRMWTDTAMLAGYLDPDVDRVISAYVSGAIGADPATTPAERVIAALTDVAARFESSILPLEFAILNHERA